MLELYIGYEFLKNHFAIVSGSFIYQSASRPIGCVHNYKQCLYEQTCLYFVGCDSGTVTFGQ